MWQTGIISTFQSRMHQLPTGVADLITGFLPEGQNYTGIVPMYQNIMWNKEFNKKWENVSDEPMATGRWFY
jgi:hypothetical protein